LLQKNLLPCFWSFYFLVFLLFGSGVGGMQGGLLVEACGLGAPGSTIVRLLTAALVADVRGQAKQRKVFDYVCKTLLQPLVQAWHVGPRASDGALDSGLEGLLALVLCHAEHLPSYPSANDWGEPGAKRSYVRGLYDALGAMLQAPDAAVLEAALAFIPRFFAHFAAACQHVTHPHTHTTKKIKSNQKNCEAWLHLLFSCLLDCEMCCPVGIRPFLF
jgi:hypothetical protein